MQLVKLQYLVYNVIKQLNLEILFKYAKDLKADALVTGHYVAREQRNGHANMYRAKIKIEIKVISYLAQLKNN